MSGPRRRAAGEGSIYEIKTGKYKGQYAAAATISRPGEKRRRRVFRGAKREEVRQKLLTFQRNNIQPNAVAPARETVAGLLASFLSERSSRVRSNTIKQYRFVVEQHIEPFIGKRRIADFTPDDADEFLVTLRDRGRSAQMQRLARVVLFMAWKLAVKRRRVFSNPFDAVDPINVPRKRMTTWDEDQVRTFLDIARGDRFERLFILALAVGMREGELLGLRRSDVNLRERTVFIQETAIAMGPSGAAKTPQSRRRINLPEIALDAVRDQLRAVMANRKTARSEWVFPDAEGGVFAARNLRQRHFRRLADRCTCGHDAHPVREKTKTRPACDGTCQECPCKEYAAILPRIRFHDLRHTFATIALANGVPVKVVSEILGHSSIKTTLDFYSHIVPSMQSGATLTMDGVFARILAVKANPEATPGYAKGP